MHLHHVPRRTLTTRLTRLCLQVVLDADLAAAACSPSPYAGLLPAGASKATPRELWAAPPGPGTWYLAVRTVEAMPGGMDLRPAGLPLCLALRCARQCRWSVEYSCRLGTEPVS